MKRSILVAGHGYVGKHLTGLLDVDTFAITTTSRNPDNRQNRLTGFPTMKLNVLDRSDRTRLPAFEQVVYGIGRDPSSNHSADEIYAEGLSNFIDRMPKPAERFVYISSTGVYGNPACDEITETSPTAPERESARSILKAEQILERKRPGREVIILRLAGIYGPGRIPNRQRLEKGQLTVAADGMLNLIHIQDAARIICGFISSELKTGSSLNVLNVSDGNPVFRRDFYRLVCQYLGLKEPAFTIPAQDLLSSKARDTSRLANRKKISNRKLIGQTGYRFLFPDFRSGLADIFSNKGS